MRPEEKISNQKVQKRNVMCPFCKGEVILVLEKVENKNPTWSSKNVYFCDKCKKLLNDNLVEINL